ncbi:MAG: 2Fe-2S iron-sulfur cluster-binding protein [Candidatus Thermoplasmatota archaeon]
MKTVTLRIDDKIVQVEEGTTVLKAARKAGIEIPTLCYHDRLEPYGACRFCMVEIEKNNRRRLVASCCYPAEDGLIVKTKTENIDKIRKTLAELLLAVSPNGKHVEIAKQYNIYTSRFKTVENPETPCNLCGLCVRYCREIKKNNAACFVGRGTERSITLVPGASEYCLSCRECFNVCDAGKLVYLVDMLQDVSCPPLKAKSNVDRT